MFAGIFSGFLVLVGLAFGDALGGAFVGVALAGLVDGVVLREAKDEFAG
jgi:hypothetical protein